MLYVDPGATLAWSADEIAERSVQLTPICIDGEINPEKTGRRELSLVNSLRPLFLERTERYRYHGRLGRMERHP